MDKAAPNGSGLTTFPWLKDHEPRSGRLARPLLRSALAIAEVERVSPDAVLPGATIYACLRAAADSNPSKPAILHLLSADPTAAPLTLTYAQLLHQIERAATLFRRLAGEERSAVSIILPMLPEALVASWGAATAGIANPINPYLEIRQVAAIMNAARATVLVTTTRKYGPGAWDKLHELLGQVPTLIRVLYVDAPDSPDDFAGALANEGPGLGFEPGNDPHAEAVYLPTGGTTAAPKLVRMTHRGQLLAAWIMGGLAGSESDCVVGHAMPNFHVGGSVILSLRAILFGQTVLTLTTDGFRNPGVVKNFWDIARTYRMTSLISTPATAAAILALPPEVMSEGHCIRSFNAGGSTIPVELLRGFHERYGVWLRELWGMSEIHGAVSSHPGTDSEPMAGSVGVHLPWHPVKAIEVDAQNRFVRECAPGERGVLIIGGPGVTPGYVDSSLDAEFFVRDMPDGLRWANTGDLGTVDETGHIWMFGRAKDVIVRGGHNIDPRMIEEVLVCHPAVQIAAAIGKPDASKGEMPIAYVQLKQGQSVEPGELIALCKDKVQERAGVPVEIFVIPAMPMTAVGKINKPTLRVDATRRVATEVAGGIVGGAVDVAVDESGRRPKVIIKAGVATDRIASVQSQLEVAFKTFEFLTEIRVKAA
ncbi:MAG: AMP-binding protein [Panacagrimonas sp.]